MIENLPLYVPLFFGLTALVTVSIIYGALQRLSFITSTAKVMMIVLPFWLLFQATLGVSGFYLNTASFPPRLLAFALLPALLTIAALFVFARESLLSRFSLKTLTYIHVIRIPVEFSLLLLFQYGLIPQLMTFEGRNFDILSGLTAPIVGYLAFRGGRVNRPLLLVWNVFALLLLINIVTNAILSIPSPAQQFAFDQPNVGVLYFPFNWLPSTVVPIVLFCHLVSFYQLIFNKSER